MDPKTTHHDNLRLIDQIVRMRNEHVAEEPHCGMAPLCVGAEALGVLALHSARGPLSPHRLILSAITRIAELEQRLEAQREATADGLMSCERERGRHEAREQQLLGRIDDLEHRLIAAQAELTAWEEAADVVGPIGDQVIEP